MIVKVEAIYRNGRVEFAKPQEAPPEGTPVVVEYETRRRRSFQAHAGVLSRDEAREMMAAIEEGCEKIDRNG